MNLPAAMHDSFGIPVNVHVQASVQNNSPKGGLRPDALPIPDRGEGGVGSTGSPRVRNSRDKPPTTRKEPADGEKMLANNTSETGLISKICEELIRLNTKKQFTLKTGRGPEDTFLQRGTQMPIDT